MSLEDLGNIGEFVAAIAVVVSLIYLAVQIRQNTRTLRLGSIQTIHENYQARLRMTAESESLARIMRTGIIRLDDLTKEEQMRFNAVWAISVLQFRIVMQLHKTGVLDHSTFTGFEADLVSNLLSPGLREWWQIVQRRYDPELRDHVNAALSATESAPPALADEFPWFRQDVGQSKS
jgi:hypothetical protein